MSARFASDITCKKRCNDMAVDKVARGKRGALKHGTKAQRRRLRPRSRRSRRCAACSRPSSSQSTARPWKHGPGPKGGGRRTAQASLPMRTSMARKTSAARNARHRHACIDHRPGRQAVRKGAGQGGDALLHGPCTDGEPERPDRRSRRHPRLEPRRGAGRAAPHRAARRPIERGYPGRRQGIRRARLRCRAARDQRQPAPGAEQQRAAVELVAVHRATPARWRWTETEGRPEGRAMLAAAGSTR